MIWLNPKNLSVWDKITQVNTILKTCDCNLKTCYLVENKNGYVVPTRTLHLVISKARTIIVLWRTMELDKIKHGSLYISCTLFKPQNYINSKSKEISRVGNKYLCEDDNECQWMSC